MTSPAIFSPPSTIKPTLLPPSLRATATSASTYRNPSFSISNPRITTAVATSASASASDSRTTFETPTAPSEGEYSVKIGARVRVKAPLKVYHVPKVPEVDLSGKEGVVKENIAVWKGKHISANYPVKIEFLEVLQGRGDKPVKFFAHLREDEFDYIH